MSVSFVLNSDNNRFLILRNPEFGDTEKLESQRIIQRNRGGDFFIIRPIYWSATYTISIQFKYLSYDAIKAALVFFQVTLGQEIIYTDPIGKQYLVIISNPNKDVVQNGRYNYELSLDMQVVVPDTPIPV